MADIKAELEATAAQLSAKRIGKGENARSGHYKPKKAKPKRRKKK